MHTIATSCLHALQKCNFVLAHTQGPYSGRARANLEMCPPALPFIQPRNKLAKQKNNLQGKNNGKLIFCTIILI